METRFIRSEYSLSLITDKVLKDEEDILIMLNNLKKNNVEFSLVMKKFFQSDYEYKTFNYDKVRIRQINEEEETVDLVYFARNGRLVLKDVKFEDLLEIRATTAKNKILEEYEGISRWNLLDFEEDK